jgi:hypothetical protein
MSNSSRDPAAEKGFANGDRPKKALKLMGEALDLIDANGGPHDVGAYLDQAMCRLKEWIEKRDG